MKLIKYSNNLAIYEVKVLENFPTNSKMFVSNFLPFAQGHHQKMTSVLPIHLTPQGPYSFQVKKHHCF